jgi:hypothetical protein
LQNAVVQVGARDAAAIVFSAVEQMGMHIALAHL